MGNKPSSSFVEEATEPLLAGERSSPLMSPRSHAVAEGRVSDPIQQAETDMESLDFAPIHSRVFATELKLRYPGSTLRHFYGYTGRTVAKWNCTLLIGVCTGLAAYAIEGFTEVIRGWKNDYMMETIRHGYPWAGLALMSGYGVVVAGLVAVMCTYWAPAAAGGGVTSVIANLNGIHIPELLSPRTLFAKILGTMGAITTNMAVGPEGPLVHIGAAMASVVSATYYLFFDNLYRGMGPGSATWMQAVGPLLQATQSASLTPANSMTSSRRSSVGDDGLGSFGTWGRGPSISTLAERAVETVDRERMQGVGGRNRGMGGWRMGEQTLSPILEPARSTSSASVESLSPGAMAQAAPHFSEVTEVTGTAGRPEASGDQARSSPRRLAAPPPAPLPHTSPPPHPNPSPSSPPSGGFGFPQHVLLDPELGTPPPPLPGPLWAQALRPVMGGFPQHTLLDPEPLPPPLAGPVVGVHEDEARESVPHGPPAGAAAAMPMPADAGASSLFQMGEQAGGEGMGFSFNPLEVNLVRYGGVGGVGEDEDLDETIEKRRLDRRTIMERFQAWLKRPRKPRAVDFHTDVDQREFISAGAAAGVSAAFGAPVGGVLFSLEEASSFWSKKVMWRSLLCATIATLTLSLCRGGGTISHTGLLSFHFLRPSLNVHDMPFFTITAGLVGLLGVMFQWGHEIMPRVTSKSKPLRVLEVCFWAAFSVGLAYGLSWYYGTCVPQPKSWADDDNYGLEFTCAQVSGQPRMVNDLATLFFSVPDGTIRHLMEVGNGKVTPFSNQSLVVFTLGYFVLFEVAYGVAMPGGLFMPSMLIGASFGALCGIFLDWLLPQWTVQPGLHALVGATAMLGGLFRGSVSLVVIVVEGTGGIDFILPIIIAVVISNYVAGHFGHMGTYETDLEKNGMHILHSEPPHELAHVTARDICSTAVVGFDKVVRVSDVLDTLRRTRHNGFPVFTYHREAGGKDRRALMGIILRSQLLAMLENKAWVSYRRVTRSDSLSKHQDHHHMFNKMKITRAMIELDREMRLYHLLHYPHNRQLSSLPMAVDELKLVEVERRRSVTRRRTSSFGRWDHEEAEGPSQIPTGEDIAQTPTHAGIDTEDLALDLRPFMNHAPLAVRRECSAHRVHVMFRALGLRHLPVVDSQDRVVGIITRKDLAKAAHHAHQGRGGQNHSASGSGLLPSHHFVSGGHTF